MRIVRVPCSNPNCKNMVRTVTLKQGEEVPKHEKCEDCREKEKRDRWRRPNPLGIHWDDY